MNGCVECSNKAVQIVAIEPDLIFYEQRLKDVLYKAQLDKPVKSLCFKILTVNLVTVNFSPKIKDFYTFHRRSVSNGKIVFAKQFYQLFKQRL